MTKKEGQWLNAGGGGKVSFWVTADTDFRYWKLTLHLQSDRKRKECEKRGMPLDHVITEA